MAAQSQIGGLSGCWPVRLQGESPASGLARGVADRRDVDTGDLGKLDSRGFIRITGRVKDIFKSAKGKYIVPVPIEARLGANPLLEQVCVIGAGMPAPVAVAVLSEAGKRQPRASLEQNLETMLTQVNARLESHERLSNLLLVDDEWTPDNDLLTPTLKVKRAKVLARYADAVEAMYRGGPAS